MPKVVVYLPARQQRELEAAGHDAAEWVREVVKQALAARRGEVKSHARGDAPR